jgi:uncharacterized protein with GYD domain
MAKYLLTASYSVEGVRGVMKDGGTKRETAARTLIESLGGKLHSFYYAHGKHDVVAVCEFADTAHALAAVMAVNGSGFVAASTTPLITPAEVDAAAKLHGTYRAPGE